MTSMLLDPVTGHKVLDRVDREKCGPSQTFQGKF